MSEKAKPPKERVTPWAAAGNKSAYHYLTTSDVDLQQYAPRAFKYDSGLLSALKAEIPVSGRIWSPDDKLWYFHQSIISTADKLIHRYTATDALTGLDWRQSWMSLYLRPGAPECVINAATGALLSLTSDPARRHRIETAKRICLEW